jgi:hypothetical protein
VSVSACFLFLLIETLAAGGGLVSRFDKGGEDGVTPSGFPTNGPVRIPSLGATVCFNAACDTMSQLCGVLADAVVNDRSDEVLLSES